MIGLILLGFNFLFATLSATELDPINIPEHPYLAKVPNLHLDHYFSSVSNEIAPSASSPLVVKHTYGGFGKPVLRQLSLSLCLNIMVDNQDRLYGFCGSPSRGYLGGIDLYLTYFDVDTLAKKDQYLVAKIPLQNLIRNDLPLNLGYFNMDSDGNAIVVLEANQVKFVGLSSEEKLIEKKSIDLAPHTPQNTVVAQVMPDYNGDYWFMSLGDNDPKNSADAYMGIYDPVTGKSSIHVFDGEVIENGFAMDQAGVYVATDRSLYMLAKDQGKIKVQWKEDYERATYIKPGTISFYGSGSAPTLLESDLVAITDNADGRINLLVYKRSPQALAQRLVCKTPLFKEGKSANENSVVGYKSSVIVQNAFDAPGFFGNVSTMEPGVARIDVRNDRSGCDLIWENYEISATSTMKLSTKSGMLYAATQKKWSRFRESSYMSYVDFNTGKVENEVYMGSGFWNRFLAAPVSFAPGGRIIQPVFSGLVSIEDIGPPKPSLAP